MSGARLLGRHGLRTTPFVRWLLDLRALEDIGIRLMIALPHIPIGAVECVADEFKIFDTLPVLWHFRSDEEMLPPPPCEVPPTDFGFACGMSPHQKRADGR